MIDVHAFLEAIGAGAAVGAVIVAIFGIAALITVRIVIARIDSDLKNRKF